MKARIKVKAEFYAVKNIGRAVPFHLGNRYRPFLRLLGGSEYYEVQFTEGTGTIIPGEPVETDLWLTKYPGVAYEKLKEGREFILLENSRPVGSGKIIGPMVLVDSQ